MARLFVEPDVFHTPAVEDAIDHARPPLDVGLPTHRAAVVKDDRPGTVFGQLSLNCPHQRLALLGVRLNGLPLDQFVDLGTAIAVVVQLPAAPVRYVEAVVGVDPGALAGETHNVVLAHDLGEPVGGVDRFEFAVDINLLELVDQYYRRVAQEREVAHRQLYPEPVSRPIAEILHDLTSLAAVFLHIGVVAGHRLQHIRRYPP